ncbi:MAG: PAS domain S-box protein [bacterium]
MSTYPGKRILLVEDEALIAMSETAELEACGYEVNAAPHMHSSIRRSVAVFALMTLSAVSLVPQTDPGIAESRLFEEHGSVMLIIDPDTGSIVAANEAARAFYGYDDLRERTINSINQLSAAEVSEEMRLAATQQRNFFRFIHATRDRGLRHVEVYSYPIDFNGGSYLFSIIIDVTERMEAEQDIVRLRRSLVIAIGVGTAVFFLFLLLVIVRIRERLGATKTSLKQTEQRYRTYVDNAPLGVFVTDRAGRFLEVNPAACDLTGYGNNEMLRMTISDLLHPDDLDNASKHFQSLRDGESASVELRFCTRSGQVRWWSVNAIRLAEDHYLGLAEDTSERKQNEHERAMLVHEKERLLQEVRHRVKNNMSAMEGLLDLQARSLSDTVAVEAIREAQTRFQSLRVLYEQLFRADTSDIASVNEYLATLVESVLSVFPPIPGLEVIVRTDPKDGDCMLDAVRLPTVGLIVNELLTNALKYAFPPSSGRGLLQLDLRYNDEEIEVSVLDNGPGIPNAVVAQPGSGFGLGMVGALVEQLKGRMDIDSRVGEETGTRITFSFPR